MLLGSVCVIWCWSTKSEWVFVFWSMFFMFIIIGFVLFTVRYKTWKHSISLGFHFQALIIVDYCHSGQFWVILGKFQVTLDSLYLILDTFLIILDTVWVIFWVILYRFWAIFDNSESFCQFWSYFGYNFNHFWTVWGPFR